MTLANVLINLISPKIRDMMMMMIMMVKVPILPCAEKIETLCYPPGCATRQSDKPNLLDL